jgi:hypothetical protein
LFAKWNRLDETDEDLRFFLLELVNADVFIVIKIEYKIFYISFFFGYKQMKWAVFYFIFLNKILYKYIYIIHINIAVRAYELKYKLFFQKIISERP